MIRKTVAFLLLCAFLSAGNVQAGIVEDMTKAQAPQKTEDTKQTKESVATQVQKKELPPICVGASSHEKCYERFDKVFHKALNENRTIFNECLARAAVRLPDGMLMTLAKGPVTLENGEKIDLVRATNILAQENASKIAACLLALSHTISDDMAKEFGIEFKKINHLEKFDKSEKEYREKHPAINEVID